MTIIFFLFFHNLKFMLSVELGNWLAGSVPHFSPSPKLLRKGLLSISSVSCVVATLKNKPPAFCTTSPVRSFSLLGIVTIILIRDLCVYYVAQSRKGTFPFMYSFRCGTQERGQYKHVLVAY